jgi:hypothetical protein
MGKGAQVAVKAVQAVSVVRVVATAALVLILAATGATHTTALRRARYRGLANTHLDHSVSATALNLIRLRAWRNGHLLDRAKHSHLARLQLHINI